MYVYKEEQTNRPHLDIRRRSDLARPHSTLLGQPRHVQGSPPRGEVDGPKAVRLAHSEQVLERRLLTKERLVVRLVAVLKQPAPEQKNAARSNPVSQAHPLDKPASVLRVHGVVDRILPGGGVQRGHL